MMQKNYSKLKICKFSHHRSKILLQKMQIKFSKHKNHENYHHNNCKESRGKNLVAANKFLFSFPLIPCWAFHEYFIRSMWIINIFVWIEFHFTIILFEYHRKTWKCSFSQFYFALFPVCSLVMCKLKIYKKFTKGIGMMIKMLWTSRRGD